jgi:hypothetical protein
MSFCFVGINGEKVSRDTQLGFSGLKKRIRSKMEYMIDLEQLQQKLLK